MSTRYPRRPERPRTDLNTPEWRERLNSIESWIDQLLHDKEPRLQVGAIWGPRGSGKSSLLRTLARDLQQKKLEGLVLPKPDPEASEAAPRVGDDPLFAPDLIDDTNGDHLFSHILKFLGSNYAPLRGALLQEPLALLTRHRHFDDFRNFDRDTATSTDRLQASLTARLGERATFSAELRKNLAGCVPSDVRYLLLVDDIDLVPHRGPELLTLLHTYLRDLPFIVLLAADREQLVEHATIHLEKLHRRADRSLALQTLSKQIPYEWHVPRPTAEIARKDLLGQTTAHTAPLDTPLGPTLAKALHDAAAILRGGWSRHIKREDPRAERDHNPPWSTNIETLLDDFVASNWRAINITYNRLATLKETLDSDRAQSSELSVRLGIRQELLLPFLTMFIALDAQIPELGLQDALDRDPDDLHQYLPRPPPEQNQSVDRPALPSAPPMLLEHAPHDRLRTPWLSGRMISYASDRLARLATTWDIMRAASTYITRGVKAIYAISLVTDAHQELARPGLGLNGLFPDLASSEPKHIDHNFRTARPGAAAIRQLIEDPILAAELAEILPDSALYPRAPLSFSAWLGWQLRQSVGQPVVLGLYDDLLTPFSVNSSDIVHNSTEPILLEPPISMTPPSDDTAPPEFTEQRPGEALILLDVRPKPDLSSRALHLWSRDNRQVHPEYQYKLASSHGFEITPDNFIGILADVLWLFRSLRDERGVTRFHLALATSVPLAFFVGRELHAFIPVDLYEHDPDTSSYRYVTTLK